MGGTAFYYSCHMYWNTTGRLNGGPCNFVLTTPDCSFGRAGGKPFDEKFLVRYPCFIKVGENKFDRKATPGCEPGNAELIDRDGFKIQIGGPPDNEKSLVLDFDVDPKQICRQDVGSLIKMVLEKPFGTEKGFPFLQIQKKETATQLHAKPLLIVQMRIKSLYLIS